jgi:RluA family pseudouridine synthase
MVAAQLFPQYSRSKLQQWIRGGVLTLNGNAARPKDKVPAGAVLEINVELEDLADGPEPIPLRIEFEDDDLLVVNKPAGLVVHPGAGNPNGTLLNALLYHAPECRELPRAGIIHRLDKDTSGLLVVAKRLPAMTSLVQQLQRRTVKREYEAIALGSPKFSGEVQLPIGRHPTAPVWSLRAYEVCSGDWTDSPDQGAHAAPWLPSRWRRRLWHPENTQGQDLSRVVAGAVQAGTACQETGIFASD